MGKIRTYDNQEITIIANGIYQSGDSLIIQLIPDQDKNILDYEEIFSNTLITSKIVVLDSNGEPFQPYTGFTKIQEIKKLYDIVIDHVIDEAGGKQDVKGNAIYVHMKRPTQSELVYAVAQIQAQTLTDEQALSVQDIYPKWSGLSIDYAAGHKVMHEGILYKCLQVHTSQAVWSPAAAPSLWAKILISDNGTIPEWEQPDSTNPYMAGDKVTHNGKTYESLVDNNVWEPGVTGTETLWQEVTETE